MLCKGFCDNFSAKTVEFALPPLPFTLVVVLLNTTTHWYMPGLKPGAGPAQYYNPQAHARAQTWRWSCSILQPTGTCQGSNLALVLLNTTTHRHMPGLKPGAGPAQYYNPQAHARAQTWRWSCSILQPTGTCQGSNLALVLLNTTTHRHMPGLKPGAGPAQYYNPLVHARAQTWRWSCSILESTGTCQGSNLSANPNYEAYHVSTGISGWNFFHFIQKQVDRFDKLSLQINLTLSLNLVEYI